MQSDNDSSTAMVDPGLDASEYQEDRAVEWLLEQDYADPAEKLFTVSEQGRNTGTGLMEYEVEIANRPMFGSEGSSDDLSFFVSEEIVMSESGATDIFSGSNLNSDVAPESEDANAAGFSMAVDLTRFAQLHSEHEMEHVEEGFDILGLDEDDDIGERHVVMQKNSANKRKKNLRAVASTKAPEEKVDAAISLDIAELANLELNPPVAVSLLELPQVELSLEEPELEIEDLPTLEIIDDDAKTLSTEFEGFLSDTSLFSSNPEVFENQSSEVLADSVEQQIESTGHDASEIQIDLGDVLDLEKNSTDELVTADIDESSNFLSAQALSLAIVVPDQAELETPAVEEMSFDLQPIDLDVAFAELGEVTLEDNAQIEDEPELPAIAQELETRIELKLELALEPELGFDRSTDVQIAMETQSEILLPAQVARASEGSIAMVSSQGFLSVEQEHQPSDEAGEISASEEFGVMDYLAANEPPLDDAEFDQYLLAGEHLEDPNLNLEELVVDVTEGVVSVDPQLETTIDYHEDFNAQEGLNNDFVTAITGVIDQVMEELSACVNERLSTLLVVPESVQVEVMLGTDDVSMKQAREENYLPILEVATTTLAALSSLGQAEIDSIHVRFSNIYDDSDWNQLFSDDFVVPHSVASSAALASGDFPEFARELSAESVFDEETLSELDVLPSIPVLSDFDLETDAIFGEDIFSGDLTEEFAPVDEGSDFDFEALILSLADVETDIGEICGVSVDQFADTDAANSADTCPIVLPQESVAAVMASKTTDSGLSWCVPANINFSYTNQPSTEIFSEFLDAFIEEGASELEKLEDALGEWEKDISSESAYLPIPRILHTLKGIAKGVGLQRYGTLIHNFETLLDGLDRPEVGEQAAYFRTVNGWLDASAKGFERIEKERTDIASELPTHSSSPVLDKVKAVVAQIEPELPVSVQALPDEPVGTPQLIATDAKSKDKQLADEGAKVLAAQQTIRMTPEALDRLLSLTNEAQQLGVRSSQATVRSKRSAAELLTRLSSVRAHVSKIAERTLLNVTAKGGRPSSTMDALEMDQYSELQEAANFLREGVEDLDDLIHLSSRQNTVAEALLKQQASIISSLGSSIQAARVIPVSRLMPGLRRIVRTVSADLGKSVSFRVLNEVGTLDRDNHARCQIILEHMTRNALDHGIETPEVRAAAGKDTTGSITIEARKLGSDYIVTLSDDGKGIDPEFMKDMAYERGLDIDVDQLSDEEAIRLIFHKGFSTATAVSEISGRGVGMDIVLSELQHIGGDIEIESTVGVGTTFKVRIPSNVTVNGALLVVAGEVSYAIPLDGLIAVEHVPVDIFYDAIRDNSQLSIFGMDCDPAYLATICHGDSLPDRSSWNATVPVIVAGSESRYMAIAIDDVTQALELVIRSLGAQFSMIPGLAGGATTADGKSIVALDLNALVESASSDALSSVSLRTEPEERMLVLVVDDSRTQRMVATSQFDNLGVETVTAENGLVAIDLLNTTHRLPDVILLDIEMPVKDGIQTLREIRKSTRYSDLPVIMVTSRTGAKHRALAEEAGCNGYMGKPFNFPKLVEQIADLTNHKFQLS